MLGLGGAPAWMMSRQHILQQFHDSLGADERRLELVSPKALVGPASVQSLLSTPFALKQRQRNRDSLARQFSHGVKPLPDGQIRVPRSGDEFVRRIGQLCVRARGRFAWRRQRGRRLFRWLSQVESRGSRGLDDVRDHVFGRRSGRCSFSQLELEQSWNHCGQATRQCIAESRTYLEGGPRAASPRRETERGPCASSRARPE